MKGHRICTYLKCSLQRFYPRSFLIGSPRPRGGYHWSCSQNVLVWQARFHNLIPAWIPGNGGLLEVPILAPQGAGIQHSWTWSSRIGAETGFCSCRWVSSSSVSRSIRCSPGEPVQLQCSHRHCLTPCKHKGWHCCSY